MAEPTLEDVLERLDRAAAATEAAAASLAEDRVQIARLITLTNQLLAQSKFTADSTHRLEVTADRVATDLAASIGRADEAPAETPGAGADAALRSAKP